MPFKQFQKPLSPNINNKPEEMLGFDNEEIKEEAIEEKIDQEASEFLIEEEPSQETPELLKAEEELSKEAELEAIKEEIKQASNEAETLSSNEVILEEKLSPEEGISKLEKEIEILEKKIREEVWESSPRNESELKELMAELTRRENALIQKRREFWNGKSLIDKFRESWRVGQSVNLDKTRIPPGFFSKTIAKTSQLAYFGNEISREGIKYAERKTGLFRDPIKQSEVFFEKGEIRANPLDGFIMQGFLSENKFFSLSFNIDRKTGTVLMKDRLAEIVRIDREKDKVLKEMCDWARELKERNLPIEERAFLVAQKTYNRMGGGESEAIKEYVKKLEESKEDKFIGKIEKGNCRHRALLAQVLGNEAGIDICSRAGYLNSLSNCGAHAWNEIIDENGKTLIMDIMNPPDEDFGNLTYEEFKKRGGFPASNTSRLGDFKRYIGIKGERIYSGASKDEVLKRKLEKLESKYLEEINKILDGQESEDEKKGKINEMKERYEERIKDITEVVELHEDTLNFNEELIRPIKK